MNFWEWLSGNNATDKFPYIKRGIVIVLLFFIIPFLIYSSIYSLSFTSNEELSIGFWIFLALYLYSVWLYYKKQQSEDRFNQLLDKLLDEKQAETLFEVAMSHRKSLQEKDFPISINLDRRSKDRYRLFGIK